MSFLADFGGAFFTGVGNEMQQRENEDRQLRLQMALEDRRRRISRQDRFSDLVTENNLNAKPYVGYDSQGRMGLLQDEFAMGDTGPTRTARRLGDAPRVPSGEVERKVGDKIVRYRQFSDGTEEVIAEAPRYKPGDGSVRSDRRRFTTVTNPDGSKSQYDEQTGELVRELPAKAGKREDQADSKAALEKFGAITKAQSVVEVKDILRANGINPESQEVLNLPIGSDGDYLTSLKQYAKDAITGKGKREESAPIAGIPPAAVSDLKADPSPQAQAEFDAVFGKGAAKRVLGSR